MITEKQANKAREKHSDSLVRKGAHAISVDEVKEKGKKSFAVKVFVDKVSKAMPQFLTLKDKNATINVPVIVQKEEKFKLE
jgi:hypothetical protein